MNLTDNEILKFLKGSPVLFYDICAVYPATLGEIVDEGYDKFQGYLNIITMEKPPLGKQEAPELKEFFNSLTDFQYILLIASTDLTLNNLLKSAFRFFTHEEISFSLEPAQIVIGPLEEKHLITEEKFYELQSLLRRMYFLEQEGDDIIINADDPPATKALKMKMRENRAKVRRAKAKQAAKEKSDLKFSDLVGSLTINNVNVSMENVWNLTYYAFHDQLKRMGWRDQYDLNTHAAMAGAKLKQSQLKHWMRSIANSDKS